jgi:hypothetical protein
MEGSRMGQVRHGSATTTHAVRAAIQRSQASLATLSRELGINPKTLEFIDFIRRCDAPHQGAGESLGVTFRMNSGVDNYKFIPANPSDSVL